jgi:hypothetical protein
VADQVVFLETTLVQIALRASFKDALKVASTIVLLMDLKVLLKV